MLSLDSVEFSYGASQNTVLKIYTCNKIVEKLSHLALCFCASVGTLSHDYESR